MLSKKGDLLNLFVKNAISSYRKYLRDLYFLSCGQRGNDISLGIKKNVKIVRAIIPRASPTWELSTIAFMRVVVDR